MSHLSAAAAHTAAAAAAALAAQEEDGAEEETCFVCLDGRKDAILLECGHGGLCVQCAQV